MLHIPNPKHYLVPLSVVTLLVIAAAPASGAFFIPDIVTQVKEMLAPPEKKALTIESSIRLAPGGDLNQNGQIDSGDSVTFAYKITNSTDNKYTFATLKTNVPRKQLNFVRNITGASGIKDTGETVNIANLRILPQSQQVISFDARVNYYQDSDKKLSTQAELVDAKGVSLLKTDKKEAIAKKLSKEEFSKFVKPAVTKGASNAQ